MTEVFIVDDRVHEISWLTQFLKDDLNCEVTLKTNEKHTKEHFESFRVDSSVKSVPYSLAIVDIMIPVAPMAELVVLDKELLNNSRDTGIRLCKFFRHELGISEQEMPIVAISARGDEDLIREMRELKVPLFGRDELEIRDFIKDVLARP